MEKLAVAAGGGQVVGEVDPQGDEPLPQVSAAAGRDSGELALGAEPLLEVDPPGEAEYRDRELLRLRDPAGGVRVHHDRVDVEILHPDEAAQESLVARDEVPLEGRGDVVALQRGQDAIAEAHHQGAVDERVRGGGVPLEIERGPAAHELPGGAESDRAAEAIGAAGLHAQVTLDVEERSVEITEALLEVARLRGDHHRYSTLRVYASSGGCPSCARPGGGPTKRSRRSWTGPSHSLRILFFVSRMVEIGAE